MLNWSPNCCKMNSHNIKQTDLKCSPCILCIAVRFHIDIIFILIISVEYVTWGSYYACIYYVDLLERTVNTSVLMTYYNITLSQFNVLENEQAVVCSRLRCRIDCPRTVISSD